MSPFPFVGYFGAGLLGGLLLNVMPCVLPVLTMKVFHLVGAGSQSPSSRRRHGFVYTGGILATFTVFAAGVVALRASGDAVGWGMQFQNPTWVAALTVLMLILALNGLGVFQISVSYQPKRRRATDPGAVVQKPSAEDSYLASFLNGVIVSVMATPCSAPFLGTAAAFALGSGAMWWETWTIFLAIGLGLALPFLAVSAWPSLSRRLPKPGSWMEVFKALMGFTLMGAAVWLYGVLMGQLEDSAAFWFLAFLLLVSLGLWTINHFGGFVHGMTRRLLVRVAVFCVCVLGWMVMVDLTPRASTVAPAPRDELVVVDGHIAWAPFSPFAIALAQSRHRPVFVDYTADWCLSCKTQEKLFIETKAVRSALQRSMILPMIADWTNADEQITKWLGNLGRTGIPAYAIYLPDGSFDLLPEVITESMVLERLARASARFPPSGFLSVEEACQHR